MSLFVLPRTEAPIIAKTLLQEHSYHISFVGSAAKALEKGSCTHRDTFDLEVFMTLRLLLRSWWLINLCSDNASYEATH